MPGMCVVCPLMDESIVIPVGELISVRQASRQFNVPTRTLYRWVAQGRITRLVVGGHTMLHVDELSKTVKDI